MNGFRLFSRTSAKGSWNIASWHSPHSITWRWLIGFSLFRADEGRVWPIWMPHRSNIGLQWVIRIPFIGFLRFSQQRPMWYRDCYMRLRDKQDEKLGVDRPLPHSPHSPLGLTVMDGGQSLR